MNEYNQCSRSTHHLLAALFRYRFLLYTRRIVYVCVIMHCTSRGPYILHTIMCITLHGAYRRLFQHNNTNKTKRRARVRCRRTRFIEQKKKKNSSRAIAIYRIPPPTTLLAKSIHPVDCCQRVALLKVSRHPFYRRVTTRCTTAITTNSVGGGSKEDFGG